MSYRNSVRRSLWLELHTFSLHPCYFLRKLWLSLVLEGFVWIAMTAFLLYVFLPGWAALPLSASSGLISNLSTYLRAQPPVVYAGFCVWIAAMIATRSYAAERLYTAHHNLLPTGNEPIDTSHEPVAPRKYFVRMAGVNGLYAVLGLGLTAVAVAALLHHQPSWLYLLLLPVAISIGVFHAGLRLAMGSSGQLTWHRIIHCLTHQIRWGGILTICLLHGMILAVLLLLLFLPLVPVFPAQLFDSMNLHAGELSGIPPLVLPLCLFITWVSCILFSACRLILYRAVLYLQ